MEADTVTGTMNALQRRTRIACVEHADPDQIDGDNVFEDSAFKPVWPFRESTESGAGRWRDPKCGLPQPLYRTSAPGI